MGITKQPGRTKQIISDKEPSNCGVPRRYYLRILPERHVYDPRRVSLQYYDTLSCSTVGVYGHASTRPNPVRRVSRSCCVPRPALIVGRQEMTEAKLVAALKANQAAVEADLKKLGEGRGTRRHQRHEKQLITSTSPSSRPT